MPRCTSTYVSQTHYSASGQVNDQTLGNGLLHQSCYIANTLRLSGLRVYSGTLQSCGTNPSNPKLNLSYSYQSNGNVSQVMDSTRNETLNYAYDELDRLLSASGPYNKNYTYNVLGNTIDQSLTPAFVTIATGGNHTCGVTTGGGVKCWGQNTYGQLGDGTTTQRTTPVDVSGLTNGVMAITAGYYHTCALTTSGSVKCWGYNYSGQLGDGTTTRRTTPVDVSGLTSGVTAIAAGAYETCALTTSGGVKCWGFNGYGQLGDGSTTSRTTPVDVSGLTSGVMAITVGYYHTCAFTTSGGVKCWGENFNGQLGDGTTTNRTTPVNVSGLTSGVTAISAGYYHTCALTTSGGVKCWGWNFYNVLGDGTSIQRTTPVNVSGLGSGVTGIATGGFHSCALVTGGGVKCWGWNRYAQLGDGTFDEKSIPVSVSGLSAGVTSIATGEYHTCAITVDGLKCWGANTYGQLGNGVITMRTMQVNVSGLETGVLSVTSGLRHTCALTVAGSVKCWGDNTYGQLTTSGNQNQNSTPVDATGLSSGITAIAAGYYHTCALTTTGGVKCWGHNGYGQLGDGTTWRRDPVDVIGLTSGVVAITAGEYHTCALTTSGGIKCWGQNNYGQLGDATTTQRLTPVDVSGLTSGVATVAAGDKHTCALTSAGGVKCWGGNTTGALGNGTFTNTNIPVDVIWLNSGVTAIAAGAWGTCALTSSGGVKCWGKNTNGQLGDGTPVGWSVVPVDVIGLTSTLGHKSVFG